MMNGVAEKLRTGDVPGPAGGIALQLPQPFAGRNEQRDATIAGALDLRHVVDSSLATLGGGLQKLRLRVDVHNTDASLQRDAARVRGLAIFR
jgi:hypothetical protein